jgi:di/tricarboxylate transporter
LTADQIIIFLVLFGALGLFIWGRWRYDVVAVLALLVVAITGLVPAEDAFAGFGHPAVVTVATVLIISQALTNSGAVDTLGKQLSAIQHRPVLLVATLTGMVALCSGFMNNVGALALFMPIALQLCQKANRPASEILMPLSFGSLLGGLITLIGTPPNIVIATYRQKLTGEPFGMFDFTPVGLGVALVGLTFISLVGWRLLPTSRLTNTKEGTMFDINAYITEARLPEKSKLVGKALRELEKLGKGDVAILALVRGKRRLLAPGPFELLKSDDLLILEGHSDGLKTLVDETGLEMVGSQTVTAEDLSSERVGMFEAVVSPGSRIEGRSAAALQLHERFGVNLLAISRQGESMRQRISRITFRVGDVLLLQGEVKTMGETLALLGCLPLAQRNIKLGQRRRVLPASVVFGVGILLTALGLLPAHLAFTGAAVVLVLTNLLSLREAYASIQGPIIVLLGAMIPVGQALETTGATNVIAVQLVAIMGGLPDWAILAILIITAMALSDVINNAATAVIMAPIASGVATTLQYPVDPFLMAVAVGSSCTFLTPIGHQSNTLVMGPGGYAFSDYWRMGLPLGILVVVTTVPLILRFWPL